MMDLSVFETLIRKTLPKTERHYSLAFQGGEPTLRGLDFFQQAVKIVHSYERRDVEISLALQTNGLLLDEAWAEFLARERFLVGLSLDGTEPLHNAHRHMNNGKNAYKAVIKAAALLDQFHIPYNILTVVHQETAEHIQSIYQSYQARGWRFLQFIACLDPLDSMETDHPWTLSPKQYAIFLTDLFDLWYADAMKGRAPSIRQFDNWLGMLLGIPPEACDQCGVCSEQYVLEANGNVYPCDFYATDEWCLGNIATDSLNRINQVRGEIGFQERSRQVLETCRNCKWLQLCRNGCFRNRKMTESGEMLNRFCPAYKVFFETCGDRLIALAKKRRKEQYGG